MAIYTVSITDGTTLANLAVSAGRGPKGDGFTGGSYSSSTGQITFTSNDGIGFSTGDIRPEITAAVAAAEAAQAGAETAEAGAEAAQAATESIFDQFGDQYLGPKASDPTVDNDGDPLTEGDIYFNTTDSVLKFYSGSAWVAPESIATTAASDAQAAQAASEAAQAAAETAETNAETAETNAAASAAAASSSASAASTSASEAAASAASINLSSIDIDGGTIDGTVIGGSTPAAGSFTTGSFTGNVTFGDNDKAIFGGVTSELQIYSDGSNSYVDEVGVGSLRIRGYNQVRITDTSDNIAAIFKGDAETTLYHSNSPKLATTSTGVDITGTLTSDGLTVGATNGLVLDTSGATEASWTHNPASGESTISVGRNAGWGGDLNINTDTLRRMRIQNNGNISFYDSAGSSQSFFWDANAESLGIGTTSVHADLHLGAASPHIDIGPSAGNRGKVGFDSNNVYIGSTSGTGEIHFKNNIGSTDAPHSSGDTKMVITDSGVGIGTDSPSRTLSVNGVAGFGNGTIETIISFSDRGIFGTQSNHALEIRTNGSEAMRITSAGRVGINTTSPATELDVQGTTTTNGLNLDAISETIADTAVDVFVYDTSKDSDGGAWRKRTQGTSWYNETLNTATRGSRKEFPAVAVIVAEATKVTIYDGDDPDLPMWMVFNAAGNFGYAITTSSQVSSLSAFNGVLCVGSTDYSLSEINLIEDASFAYFLASLGAVSAKVKKNNDISGRNSGNGYTSLGLATIVNATVNDVAMTVLPNAPIDAATGLPVPTIAVATDGGVSVIKDDGTVVDDTATTYSNNEAGYITFLNDGRLAFGTRNAEVYTRITDIPTSDNSALKSTDVIIWNKGSSLSTVAIDVKQATTSKRSGHAYNKQTGTLAFGTAEKGLSLVKPDYIGNSDNENFAAHIDSTYNTGWMNGDIKLATLSDTDDTDVTGSELVTNGTFDSDLSGWTYNSSYYRWKTGGYLERYNLGGESSATQSITTVSGKTYVLSFDVLVASLAPVIYIGGVVFDGDLDVGSYGFTFTATSSSTELEFRTAASTLELDNVSVRLAEEDRSVNGNGLQVFGTVTKNPVNSGADLVSYGGFSASNYLEQPYNSDLDFGTGDFCYTWWANITSVPSYLTHFAREYHNGSAFVGSSIEVFTESSAGKLRIYLSDDGYSSYDVWNSSTVAFGAGWQHFAIVRTGKTVSTYINGTLDNSFTLVKAVASLDNANAKLYISRQANGGSPMTNGSLALFRASATAPSPEQIAKIYEDEKVLFQENAQATLYGSSDAVTALAYDDTTNILSVGTSAGRSDFQGLRRVNNTTNAVGAAISASNGMIVEE